MKPKLLLTITAIYGALTGLVMLFVPQVLMFSGSAGTPPGVVFALRSYGALALGVAVIHWMARNADASKARDAIFLGTTVGAALMAVVFLLDVISGGAALVVVWVVIYTLIAIAFFVVGRANMSSGAK